MLPPGVYCRFTNPTPKAFVREETCYRIVYIIWRNIVNDLSQELRPFLKGLCEINSHELAKKVNFIVDNFVNSKMIVSWKVENALGKKTLAVLPPGQRPFRAGGGLSFKTLKCYKCSCFFIRQCSL
jgi:hypothetical protein